MRRPIKWRVIRHAGTNGEEGFTVIEVMAASAVILLVMTALAYVATSSLLSVAFGKQRQAADQLLGRTMEQVRALPFQTVANGLSTTDGTVSTDPNITVNGSTWTYSGTGETIPHANISGTQAPFTPHQSSTTLNGTTYTTSAYPTNYSGGTGSYRVIAIVSWTRSLRGGVASQVSSQTIVYSPASGCLSGTNHPFAAPCQPFLHATATSDTPSIVVKPAVSGQTSISGINLSQAALTGVKDETAVSVEQTSSVLGTVITTGASLTTGSSQTSGAVAASSSADNDPGTTPGPTNTGSVSQSESAVTASGGNNSLTLTPSSTDSGSTTATASAGSVPPCSDLGGTTLSSSLPCGSGSVSQSGTTMSAAMSLSSSGSALGAATLASVGSQLVATPTRVFAARLLNPTGGYCTTTSGDGCVHVGAQRSFGTVAVGGLPANVLSSAPSGWGGSTCNNANALVSLTGYNDVVTSESGVSPAAPSATQAGGVLYYWNGSGCTSKTVSWGTSPPAITIPTVNVASPIGGGTTVTVSGTVTLGATQTTTSTNGGCVSVCTASATANSPLVASLTYVVKDNEGDTIANLEVTVTLGNIAVTTSYQAAP
ncbi:MAG: hypothetical protein JO265_13440 [Acidimicrobiia bacterium]|nr:hypothetical protein [Acidimicrobiia bacterium]